MLLHGLGPLLATLLVILGWSVLITAIVDLGSENYRYCDMSQFQNTYFHTVTCDGYVRVKMDYDSFEAMNKEIDKILENRTILHPEPRRPRVLPQRNPLDLLQDVGP
ncbi:hypothetical protein L596_027159 [Steinernema carpocapsae]|uniref:Uncharacterized protein n=1 Tax=Steinernema carpocapsae TaxID=34508 RepID=A0A4U5M3I3_STECR|nr:hypothetical protein L596_027159 [Steinernema carpocapsae]